MRKSGWPIPLAIALALAALVSCDAPEQRLLSLAGGPDPIEHEAFLLGERQLGNRCCAHSVKIVTATTDPEAPRPREGDRALRFELRYDDPEATFSSKRAEITFDGIIGLADMLGRIGGPADWYRFSVYLPDSHERDPAAEIIAQWHASPDKGEVFRGPVLSLHSRDGEWQIISRHSSEKIQTSNNAEPKRLWRAPYQTGVWTDFIFQTRWDWHAEGQGAIRAWMKPSDVVSWQKILTYRGATAYNDDGHIYFKAGLYKWPWEGCTPGDEVEACSGEGSPRPSTVERRVVYVDGLEAASGEGLDFSQFARFGPHGAREQSRSPVDDATTAVHEPRFGRQAVWALFSEEPPAIARR
ncbi:MAG: polysaccharide lyase [Geminicoccales bacterium]